MGLEFATLGGFIFGLGVTTSTGAALIGHGLCMTALNAKDVRFSNVLWKGSQVQSPSPTNSPLKSGDDPSGRFRPDKNATGPHTVFKRYEDGKN